MKEIANKLEEKKTMMKEIGTIGKFTVSKKLKKQIDYLHHKVGSTEWSGILLYKHIGGKIGDMQNLSFKSNNLFLYDIGSGGATKFDYDVDVIDMYENVEEAMDCAMGLIHTHHSMGAYHSNIDMDELNKNTENYNYYISLVVDFRESYKCKIGFPSKTKITYENKIRDTHGNWVDNVESIEETIILLGDLDVVIDGEKTRQDWFSDRYNTVVTNKLAANKLKEDKKIEARTINHGSEQRHFDTAEEYYAHNWPEIDESSNKSERLTRKFLVAILNVDPTINRPIDKSVHSLESLNDVDFEQYTVFLEANLEILHDNIYGSDQINKFDDHVNKVVDLLEKTKEIGDNVSQLLITLKVAAL